MISAISVTLQFIFLGKLLWFHAALFAVVTFIAAYVGIKGVNIYIKKSGRQSVIAILLVIVLTLSLFSLPLNFVKF